MIEPGPCANCIKFLLEYEKNNCKNLFDDKVKFSFSIDNLQPKLIFKY